MEEKWVKNQDEEYSFYGTHVFGELYGICKEDLDSIDQLEEIMTKGIENQRQIV